MLPTWRATVIVNCPLNPNCTSPCSRVWIRASTSSARSGSISVKYTSFETPAASRAMTRFVPCCSVMVIHHTRCGLESFDEEVLQSELEAHYGSRPPFRLGAYKDVDQDVRSTVLTLKASPFILDTEIRGFVFSVDDGDLHEVSID